MGYHPQVIISGRHINDEMGTFIARRTLQEMAKVGIGAVDSKVLVLELTFKEDCPDLRNSRVPDVIHELKHYGCEVLVHDPYCDLEEAQAEYSVELLHELENSQPVSAVVLAVAHQFYKSWGVHQWWKKLIPGGVVVDVKGIAPKAELYKRDIHVCRL